MKETIHYAHCVKWTVGQLDREPFSKYEAREIVVDLENIKCDDTEIEWIVRHEGKILANEQFATDALACAAYFLMNQSRIMAEVVSAETGKTFRLVTRL